MTRDKMLARNILQFVEENALKDGLNVDLVKLASVKHTSQGDVFDYHIDLLVEAGYLRLATAADGAQAFISLTWDGHDLLEAL